MLDIGGSWWDGWLMGYEARVRVRSLRQWRVPGRDMSALRAVRRRALKTRGWSVRTVVFADGSVTAAARKDGTS